MACGYKAVCPFFSKKMAVHESMYTTNVKRYCDADSSAQCAIHQVMAKTSFLNVPKDLFPNQTFRVAQILAK
jgi:hypothetical protein